MTLNDLKDEISSLGFEQEIDLDKSLVFAIRRSLCAIYTERSVYNTLSIEHRPTMPTLVCKSFVHDPETIETFKLCGRAYSFTVCGSGFFRIDENGTVSEHSFSSPLYLWRGFIDGEATITFFGEFSFEVINLAVFEKIASDREENLFSYGEPFEYKISDLRGDFHSFASMPTDAYGRDISGAMLRGNTLIIPWDYRGRINLVYKVKPPTVSIDLPNADIPIAREVEHLVALLAASYYWADDAPDKAEYYLMLYREAMKAVKQFDTRRIGGGYDDVTGWAQ